MKLLENRIPPPIVLLVALALIYWVSRMDDLITLSTGLRLNLSIGLFVLGLGVMIAGVISFRRAATTVNPLKPESASSLVNSGVFRYTRNPMYLGMLFIAVAGVVKSSSVLSLLVVLGFYLFITRYQIVPEERAMRRLFGDEFIQYKQRVRRWI